MMNKIFEGVRVLDFTNNIAGPTCTAMMSDFGAEVIKIERPKYGDDNRAFIPFVEGKSVNAMYHNRGKKSVVLDMKNPKAIELLKEMVKEVDVVVESFRPGIMARFGLDYENLKKINPKIIMCSISAFGQTGPYSQLPGYDLIAQALSGFMDLTGEADGPPMKVGPSMADYGTGHNAFGAISAALFYRERSGKGQYIDVSLLECLVASNDYCEAAFLGMDAYRNGNHHGLVAPYGAFIGNNGSIIVGALNQKLWGKLCRLIERPDMAEDPRFDTVFKRVKALDEVIDAIETWLRKFDNVVEPARLIMEQGIPCAKVNTTYDLQKDPQLLHRGMITELKTPELSMGKVTARGVHLKFSETPGELGIAPKLGEHTHEILSQLLGLSEEELKKLEEEGVF